MKKSLLIFAVIISVTACGISKTAIIQSSSTKIAIDASTDNIADTAYVNYLKPYKKLVDEQMNIVIGKASQTMRGHAPESLLSNLSADIYLKAASDFQNSKVDIAIVNLGGLRTTIPAGDITIRKVFELMPFENELVILYLKGDKLNDLCQYFAGMGGEGIAGLRFVIDNKKAVDITISGEPIDLNKVYTVATNDYLAGGNDNMNALAFYEKRINSSIKVRTMLLNYIKNQTSKGLEINSALDGRISIK